MNELEQEIEAVNSNKTAVYQDCLRAEGAWVD
jgi:hypothetical protein